MAATLYRVQLMTKVRVQRTWWLLHQVPECWENISGQTTEVSRDKHQGSRDIYTKFNIYYFSKIQKKYL